MTKELEKANDMMVALEQQRNQLSNQLVHAYAANADAQRQINALTEKVAALEKENASLRETEAIEPTPDRLANGHADHAPTSAPTG